MPQNRRAGKLAVILHADVAGSTKLVQQDEHIAHQRIQETFRRFGDTISKYNGRVRELRGDALLAEFERASGAVTAALAFQADHEKYTAKLNDSIRPIIRVGIAMGEVVIADNTITGTGVVLAQRLEQLAKPGGVVMQGAVCETVPGRFPFEFADLGEHTVKGFDKPVRAYSASLKRETDIPPPEQAGQRLRNTLVASGSIVVVVLAVALVLFKPWGEREGPVSVEDAVLLSSDKPSIAVLPFENLSGDAQQEYFVDGMTEDLITDLSKLSGLFVIARNSVFTYKDKPVKLSQVAEELGVRYVLEGSVRRFDDQVRINAQLIDATTGGHLWAERYDSNEADIFKLQDRVIREIVSALEVNLTDAEETRLARLPTNNLEAYDYYKRAEQLRQSFSTANQGDAIELYEQAVALDPDFADAHAGHGLAAWHIWRFGSDNVLPGPVARKLAYDSASKALEADPENSRAFSILALLQASDGQHQQALESARRAIDLAPGNAWAYVNLALVQVVAGQPTEAYAAMQTASRLEPNPPPWFHTLLGRVLFFNHRFEEAVQSLEKGVQSGTGHLILLAMAQAQLGQTEEAQVLIDQILKTIPFESIARSRTRYAHYKRKEDFELILDSLRKAGLTEWPFGFEANEKDRLDINAVNVATLGRTWVGYSRNGRNFVQQFTQDGKVAYRSSGTLLTGTAWSEDGMLCIRYSALDMGRASCGFLFQNPNGTIEEQNEYIYLNASDVSYFSVKP